ncbi:MAG TPA: hypothetical protein VJC13_00645, partial [Candidatus Paceibacterota bacterium]
MKHKSSNFKTYLKIFIFIFTIVTSFSFSGKVYAGICDFNSTAWGGGGYTGGEDEIEGAMDFCNGKTSSIECGAEADVGCVWDADGGGGASEPTCSITSFTADDTTPPNNTGTTLRLVLNSSFPWFISLLQGGTSPSPSSGTGSDGTATTGNLTADHVYRLTCGSATRDLPVTPTTPVTHTLTINKSGSGDGTTTGAGTYDEGDVVNMGETPITGSYFVGWEGNPDCNDGSVTMNSDKTCVARFDLIGGGNNPPNPPTISGPTTGNPSTNYSYSFVSTDPQNDKVRYGVDWDDNGTVDNWLPLGITYVNSGTSQSASHSWSTIGTKTFQALAKDDQGYSSNWQGYTVTISNVSTCQDSSANNFGQSLPCTYDGGVCGTRNTTYPIGTTGYPSGSTYCAVGTPTPPSPSFPPPGGSASWHCTGVGGSSGQCTASVEIQTSNVDDAQYIPPESVPSPMTSGAQVPISITMKNTGTTVWTSSAGYKLGSRIP